jgi:viologen exporter family transport system permease protein
MRAFRLYLRYAGVSIRSQLQYRASVLMQSVGAFLVTGVEMLAIWALFVRFGNVRGWTLPEVALFYGMISISWSLCDALGRGFEVFGTLVKAGDVDRMLLRPRSTVLQLLGHELTIRRVGRLAQGVAVLAYSLSSLDVAWTAPRLLLLVGAIAGAVCAFLGLLVLQATSTFWTVESLEIWNAFTYGGVTMSQYPLPIYRSWFRGLFTYAIPLGCVNYLPGVALLGRPDPLGTPAWAQWLAPLAGPAFLLLALAVWRIGVRHYRSTGS